MKKLIRTIAIILSVFLLAQILPVGAVDNASALPAATQAKAQELTAEEAAAAATGDTYIEPNRVEDPPEVVAEDKSKRSSESEKQFLNNNGSYTLAMYGMPVNFRNAAGEWQDIDNTLSLNSSRLSSAGRATYTPAASGTDTRFPQDFSDNQKVSITKDGFTLGMGFRVPDAAVAEPPADDEATDALPEGESPATEEETAAPEALAVAGAVNFSAKAEVNNDFVVDGEVAVDTANMTRAEKIEADNAEKMKLDNLTSSVIYRDIFPGTDLLYVLSSAQLKEYISIKELQEIYTYLFDLSLGGLIPVPQEDGSIYLYAGAEDEEPLFILEAPYMYDAAGEMSTALKMTLADDGTLTLTADAAWINDESRVLPVTIDPTVSITAQSSFDDSNVCTADKNKTYKGTDHMNYAGKGRTGTLLQTYSARTYIKFTLPTLPAGCVVINAAMTIMQRECNPYAASNYLVAYDLTGKTSMNPNTVTWNNQPVSTALNGPRDGGTVALDWAYIYNTMPGFPHYDPPLALTFNITRAVKEWYLNNNNNGFMITTLDENASHQSYIYSVRHGTSGNRPTVTMTYVNNTGLESYWNYETIDMGRSGTAYINDFSGELTYVHSDLSMSGQRLPLNIAHVYNGKIDSVYTTYYSGMNVGAKFHLNLQQLLVTISSGDALYSQGYRYKYYDDDGTLHYFKYSSSTGKTTHEFDPTLVATTSGSDRIITDAQGNKKYFNSANQLYKLVDSKGNTQTITFSGNRITQVTDGAGRVAVFGYNAYNQLTSISDPASRATTYTYSSTASTANLTGITYPGGKTTTFTYSGSDLSRVNAFNGSATAFTATNSRVTSATCYAKNGTTVINKFAFDYQKGMTKVTDNYQKSVEYIFDSAGRAVNTRNQDGLTNYTLYYTQNDGTNGSKNNKPSMTSTTQTVVANMIKDSSSEYTYYWEAFSENGASGSVNDTTAQAYRGIWSMYVTNSNGQGAYGRRYTQNIAVTPGATYTLSVYAMAPSALVGAGSAKMGFAYQSGSSWVTVKGPSLLANTAWTRYSYTFTVPAGVTNIRPCLLIEGAAGTVYFDCIQLEPAGGANPYNLVENSNFVDSLSYWTQPSGQNNVSVVTENGRKLLKIIGVPGDNGARKITQRIQLGVQSGETVIFGSKAKATAAGFDGDYRQFSVIAEFYTSAGVKIGTAIEAPFHRSVYDRDQIVAGSLTLPQAASYMDLTLVYSKQIGEARFYETFVYLDDFATRYDYNTSTGLMTDVKFDYGKNVKVTYSSSNDITKVAQTQGGITKDTTITYNSNGSVKDITDVNGVKTSYTYETGTHFVTKVTTTKGTLTTSESMTYTTDKNYVATRTDARGKTTSCAYNLQKGLLSSMTDPNGNIVSYVYNANTDALESTSGKSDVSTTVTTSFAPLTGDTILETITRTTGASATMNYSYSYDNQDRVTATKVGTQTLVTNTYDSRQRLSQQTYANGAYYTPMYDNRDRQSGEKWNGVQTAQYSYNDNNQLTQAVDMTPGGVNYSYNYALDGLVHRIIGSDGTQTAYEYLKAGQLGGLTFKKNNAIIHEARYYPNERGNPTDAVLNSLDNTILHYEYDGLSRLSEQFVGPVLSQIGYLAGTSGSTTNLVENYTNKNENGNVLQNYTYTYDNNGNIKTVKEGGVLKATYTYDGLNRLIREDNAQTSNSYQYVYDKGGNLTSVTTHAYTTGSLGAATATQSYVYGNSNWKDQMTSLGGKAITYDALGNPKTYDGFTFTWDRARLLTKFAGPGLTIDYAYDAQGHRIKQTVNSSGVITTTTFMYSGDLLMRQSDGANTMDFQYDAGGKAVGFKYNGTPYYYLRNLPGDVVGIADKVGNLVGEYRYDAWGNLTYISGSIALINPIRYRGYYADSITGWYWLNTRWYIPQWRRFVNADALFIAGDALSGGNMYAYCEGNPVMLCDPSGMAPDGYDLIWLGSKVISYLSIPFAIPFFYVANRYLLPYAEEYNLLEMMTEPIMKPAANILLPILPTEILNPIMVPIGVRNFMPANMALGAPWAAAWLGFESDDKGLLRQSYTTVEGKPMWQSEVGYDPMYDFVFSICGGIQRIIYEFEEGGTKYRLWLWKGEYWNLGAGAEIGIYYSPDGKNGFYKIATDLTLHVRMLVKYRALGFQFTSITLNEIHQTNWWVCSFTPAAQLPYLDWLDIEMDVRFTGYVSNPNTIPATVISGGNLDHLKLMKPFYARWDILKNTDDWKKITMLPYANKTKPDSTHSTHPACGARPENCNHVCPSGNIQCGGPCTHYTTKCKNGDPGCLHVGAVGNGFQFKIKY